MAGEVGQAGAGRAEATRGILLMAAATVFFTLMDVSAKVLSANLPALEIAWARYAGNFLLVAAVALPRRGLAVFATRRPGLQVVRALMLVASTVLFFFAVRYIPLADAVAIGFVAPLFVTALSVPLLGERVGLRRWAAVLVGFAGALVIVRPGLGAVHWAAGLLLAMAVSYALYQVMTRMLAATDDATVTIFYTGFVGAAVLSLVVPFVWVAPTGWLDTALLAAIGVLGGVGHWLLVLAYRYATASVLAPLHYLTLLWSIVGGYLVWGDFPDGWTLAGAAVLVATGIYVFHRERLASRRDRSATGGNR